MKYLSCRSAIIFGIILLILYPTNSCLSYPVRKSDSSLAFRTHPYLFILKFCKCKKLEGNMFKQQGTIVCRLPEIDKTHNFILSLFIYVLLLLLAFTLIELLVFILVLVVSRPFWRFAKVFDFSISLSPSLTSSIMFRKKCP